MLKCLGLLGPEQRRLRGGLIELIGLGKTFSWWAAAPAWPPAAPQGRAEAALISALWGLNGARGNGMELCGGGTGKGSVPEGGGHGTAPQGCGDGPELPEPKETQLSALGFGCCYGVQNCPRGGVDGREQPFPPAPQGGAAGEGQSPHLPTCPRRSATRGRSKLWKAPRRLGGLGGERDPRRSINLVCRKRKESTEKRFFFLATTQAGHN